MRIEKAQLLKEVSTILTESDYIFLITYKGLDVETFSGLRNDLAAKEAKCTVLKNTIIKKAAEVAELDDFAKQELIGDTAMIHGSGDVGSIAKLIVDFGKKCDLVAAKSGYFDGAVLSNNEVTAIASLPSKEVLQSQLLGVLQAPTRNLVGVLNTKATQILNVLNAYKNKLEN